jgi:nitroimidazol reductase NimA-like FMN-containing flavoprotein (pyridoxamine 5'-phosphate oxidase superfamily)
MSTFTRTIKTQVKRLPKRASYDKARVYSILDGGRVCHVGFCVDGQPYVIPTGYARVDDRLYLHGSAASRMLRTLGAGVQVCVTVTLVDGLVLARSAFHHSVNYRSVVVLGQARLVTDPDEKLQALRSFTNHLVPGRWEEVPGRWEEVRPPNEQELKATRVLALPLAEVSAKIRIGPPIDDEEDYGLPIWAGVVPVHMEWGEPVPDARVIPGVAAFSVARFRADLTGR